MARRDQAQLEGATISKAHFHPATPGAVDENGIDWNSNTLVLELADGRRAQISAGCYHFDIDVRDESDHA